MALLHKSFFAHLPFRKNLQELDLTHAVRPKGEGQDVPESKVGQALTWPDEG
jgi:hypothetical protein